ncbi:hypothetical protein SAMN05444008_11361 [Cnuella takakiae]|uniref:Uncharacterized protein n=1 Tax=Cnuella takakiae TaxID=1302690 RepID=A0A1M5F6A6_9BACT|nr:hypothetical protein SAMN05444008_11361 [Cnuella takakiae]
MGGFLQPGLQCFKAQKYSFYLGGFDDFMILFLLAMPGK